MPRWIQPIRAFDTVTGKEASGEIVFFLFYNNQNSKRLERGWIEAAEREALSCISIRFDAST